MKRLICVLAVAFGTVAQVSVAQNQVTEEWVARYSGLGGSIDTAVALAVDNEENVYVTGESNDTDTGLDYATVKYDKLGNQRWVARYDHPEASYDSARALDVDAMGSVYVTGLSYDAVTWQDYATVKYVELPAEDDTFSPR